MVIIDMDRQTVVFPRHCAQPYYLFVCIGKEVSMDRSGKAESSTVTECSSGKPTITTSMYLCT